MGCECASTCVVAFDCLIVCLQFLFTAISIIATRDPFGAEKHILKTIQSSLLSDH